MQDLWKAAASEHHHHQHEHQHQHQHQQPRNLAPLSVPGAASAGSVRVVSGSGFRYVIPFPYRLHEMLSNVDTTTTTTTATQHDSSSSSSIVSWLPDGKHFKVHDPRRFVEVVIPSAFKQKSLKSFQRQLHLYGFQRVHEGPDKGAYYHEKFLRDDRDLCLSITRAKAPKRSRASSAKNSTNNNKQQPSKLPTFHSKKNMMERRIENNSVINMNNNNNNCNAITQSSIQARNPPAVAISPSIFDDDVLPHQSMPVTELESSYGMRGPLHEVTSPVVPTNCGSSLHQQQHHHRQLSSSTPQQQQQQQHHNSTAHHNLYPPQQVRSNQQQQQQQQQQLEGSVVETCQWLINAGVPMSAFDPVAIHDVSASASASDCTTPLAFPQLVPSATSSFSPVVAVAPQHQNQNQNSSIIPPPPQTVVIRNFEMMNNNSNNISNNPTTSVVGNGMVGESGQQQQQQLTSNSNSININNNNNNKQSYNEQQGSLQQRYPMGFPAHNNSSISLETFQGEDVPFDTDHLLTDLLPGEDLPLVDDSLWAL